jgi:hypothetical protein
MCDVITFLLTAAIDLIKTSLVEIGSNAPAGAAGLPLTPNLKFAQIRLHFLCFDHLNPPKADRICFEFRISNFSMAFCFSPDRLNLSGSSTRRRA